MNPILEFKKVSFINGSNVRLQKINFSIYPYEKIAILGKSGAGKTTLIKIANGTLNPTSGSIKWKGEQVQRIKRKERVKIGTIWQDLRLIGELTVTQNINAGALGRHNIFWAIRNMVSLTNLDLCHKYLEAVGLPLELSNTKVDNLSGGQQQRVAIARLIRQNPELLLADEPISNLDPALVKGILRLLLDKTKPINFKMPSTSIISLHRPEFAKDFTRIIGLKKGKILFDFPNNEVDDSLLNKLYQ